MGVLTYSKEVPRLFPRKNNIQIYQKAKVREQNSEIFFLTTTGLILTKLGTELGERD